MRRVDFALRLTIFTFYFGLVLLAIYAPVIQHLAGYPAGENVYAFLSPICHQYPTRSFWIFDRPWALCARCSSAYFGLAIAAIAIRVRQSYFRRATFGLTLVAIAAVDPVLQLLGFYESTNVTRLLAGLVGGVGAFLIIYPIPLKYRETSK
jgi:uncharacterized membrane protein